MTLDTMEIKMNALEIEMAELNEFVIQKILGEIETNQIEVQRCRTENLPIEEKNAVFNVCKWFDALRKNLIPIVKVSVGLSENRMFNNKEFKTLREMACYFDRFKTNEVGYDKTDVTIHFADGFEYKRRYDVCMKDSSHSLHRDLLMSVKFYAGLHKPSHLSDAQYAMCVDEQSKKVFLNIYYKYQLMTN